MPTQNTYYSQAIPPSSPGNASNFYDSWKSELRYPNDSLHLPATATLTTSTLLGSFRPLSIFTTTERSYSQPDNHTH